MAVYRDDVVSIDLENGNLYRSFMNHTIGEGDEEGNRFGVKIYRNGSPVSLSDCTAVGYFVRSDGVTITISGVVSSNKAYVSLPENCYAVEGNFTLAIKLIGGGVTGTMRIVDGSVVNTSTDSVVDPGGIVPDIDELMAVIDRAEAAAETIAGFSVYAQQVSGDDYAIVVNTTS